MDDDERLHAPPPRRRGGNTGDEPGLIGKILPNGFLLAPGELDIGPARYFNQKFQRESVRLAPCQLYVTKRHQEMVETVLGSCIAACIRDPEIGVAGMNHFMLPCTDQLRTTDLTTTLRYGNHAMDMLIEGLLRRGAELERLEIKLFGGANVMSGPPVGDANAEWVLRYLADRSLAVATHDLGGSQARSIYYFPETGLVLMQVLESRERSGAEDA
jgi:chemotaxis protein CheD